MIKKLKPGDTLNLKINFKISVSKKIIFDEIQLEAYIIEKTKYFLKKHEEKEDNK